MLEDLGFKKVESKTKNELFEFENGAEFVETVWVKDFLLENRLSVFDGRRKRASLRKTRSDD